MPTTTQTDAHLEIVLTPDGGGDPITESCQIVNAEFTPASTADGDTVVTACGDRVVEPGDPANGSITGEVYKATAAGGFTRALLAALEAGTVFDFTYTENKGQAHELQFTGRAKVAPFGVTFTPNKYGRHPLQLTVVESHLAPAHAG